MHGDTQAIRRRAAQLREQAADLRASAERLVAATDAVGWSGRAGAALQARVRERAAGIRAAATRHEGAAESLEKHLAEVERRQGAGAVTGAAAQQAHASRGEPAPTVRPPAGHGASLGGALPRR